MALRHLFTCEELRRRAAMIGAMLTVAMGCLASHVVCFAQAPATAPSRAPVAAATAAPAASGAPAPAVPAALAAPVAAAAPRFKEQTEFKEPAGSKIAIIKILNEGQVTDQKMFDAWCQFRIADITLSKNASQLPEIRKKLKQELQRAKDPARSQAVTKFLGQLREIIADPAYSPTARVNAILILGDLNKTEPDVRGTGAIPLPEAQANLLKLIDNGAPVNDISDAMRAAALIGLERHAGGPMGEEAKKKLSDELRELMATPAPPAGRSSDVQEWLAGRAKGILEALGAGASATSP